MTDKKKTSKTSAKKKSTKKSADTAPYLKKTSNPEELIAETPKSKSTASLTFLLIAVITIPITAYKFNEELNSLSEKPETQENTVTIETPAVAVMQTASNRIIADRVTIDRAIVDKRPTQILEADTINNKTSNNKTIKPRHQEYEKEILVSKQGVQNNMTARHQERVKQARAKIEELKRIRQSPLEKKVKVQQMQKQIHALHEQIHKLMQEHHTLHRSQ